MSRQFKDVTRRMWMSRAVQRCHEQFKDVTSSSKMSRAGQRCHEQFKDVTSRSKMSRAGQRCHEQVKDVTSRSKMSRAGQRCQEQVKDVTSRSKMSRAVQARKCGQQSASSKVRMQIFPHRRCNDVTRALCTMHCACRQVEWHGAWPKFMLIQSSNKLGAIVCIQEPMYTSIYAINLVPLFVYKNLCLKAYMQKSFRPLSNKVGLFEVQ
jgi:hypothetical protein